MMQRSAKKPAIQFAPLCPKKPMIGNVKKSVGLKKRYVKNNVALLWNKNAKMSAIGFANK